MPMLLFKMQRQLQSDWCWAAMTASIVRHFDPDSPWCQCKLATKVTQSRKASAKASAKECCSHPYTKDLARACNQPQFLDRALRLVGRLAGPPTAGPLTFSQIQKEILAGRPVCVRIGWARATVGHFTLIYGYTKSKRGEYWLYVEDPLYGNSTWLYSEFCRNYQYADGRWSHTYPIRSGAMAKREVKRAAS